MLLIGDIHITSRYADKILSEIQNWIQSNPGEKNIIFLGDYVYHFSYDRNALLALYSFLIKLFEAGKNVYILAGNHDRLGNNFVFEEAKKAFEIILNFKGGILNTHNLGKLKFITEPLIEKIENENILFLPYTISDEGRGTPSSSAGSRDEKLMTNDQGLMTTLSESTNKNEKLSAMVNLTLSKYVDEYKKLIVIHHYYINNTKFPGQKSIFKYKDAALSESRLDNHNIRLISGHLHQAFTHKNYICTGSVWSTSSLESNQNKYLWKYEGNGKISASGIDINPYVIVESEKTLDEALLQNAWKKISEENKKNLTSTDTRDIKFTQESNLNLKDVSVFIKVKDINYENIDTHIDPKLRMQIKDIKLKKDFKDANEILKNFELSSKNLETTFADWKEILKSYLQSKYGDASAKYEELLHEMKLL